MTATQAAPPRVQGLAAAPVGGGRAWPDRETTRQARPQHTRPHWCEGRRRDLPRCRWAAAGPGQTTSQRTEHHQHTGPHWCGGRRRDRRARAGFEARRRAKRGCLASRAAGPSGARNTRGHTKPPGPTGAGRLSQYQKLISGPRQCRGLRGRSPGERWKYRAWRQRPSRFPPCGDPRRRRWRSAWPSRRRSRRRCLRSRPG